MQYKLILIGGITLLIDESIVKKFADLVLDVSKQAAIEAHKFIQTHDKIHGLGKYPEIKIIFPKDNPDYAELYEQIPFLIYDIPRYYEKEYPAGTINYSGIFFNFTGDCLDCTTLDQFLSLYDYVNSQPELKKLILQENNDLQYKLKRIVTDIVERYLFTTKATKDVPENLENELQSFVAGKIRRYVAENLNISIYIPICLATFEEDRIELAESIEIIKMSDEIQKSRQCTYTYESSKEDWVSACATHMIVLNNYHFKNAGDLSINSATQNCHAYPLQEIDNIIAAIRIVTGYSIGYEQILAHPIGWIDSFHADLVPLYGAKAHFVNPKELEKMWMNLPVSKVSCEQAHKIQQVYQNISKCEKDKNKHNLIFALKRFNRCMLRNEVDDMATDATIGLEALLAGGTKGEITFTISSRIPVVFSHIKNEQFTPSNCRSIMKKIYGYRSKIVHGGNLKEKEKYIEINNVKFDICDVAVDFLRYTLLFMTEHQEYLEATKLDEYIDSILLSKTDETNNQQTPKTE